MSNRACTKGNSSKLRDSLKNCAKKDTCKCDKEKGRGPCKRRQHAHHIVPHGLFKKYPRSQNHRRFIQKKIKILENAGLPHIDSCDNGICLPAGAHRKLHGKNAEYLKKLAKELEKADTPAEIQAKLQSIGKSIINGKFI